MALLGFLLALFSVNQKPSSHSERSSYLQAPLSSFRLSTSLCHRSVMRLASPHRAVIVTNPRCRGRLSDSSESPMWPPSLAPEGPPEKAAALLGLLDTSLCARFDRKKLRRSSGAREALRSLRVSVSRGLRRSPCRGPAQLPRAEVSAFHTDGTHSVRLSRAPNQPFGFNVSKERIDDEREGERN